MIQVKAYAKVNLALDVLFKREDGYHEVAMVMQSIDLADNVTLMSKDGDITVEANIPTLLCDKTNIAYKAAALVKSRFHITDGLHIKLEKHIPIAAGLAGGSADAAAVLEGLNKLWKLNLTMEDLEKLGAELGSDVPFCVRKGTVLATGRGEKLTTLPSLPECYFVLAKPKVGVPTSWVYGNYRAEKVEKHPDLKGMIEKLDQSDLLGVTQRVGNVLESVTVAAYPEIAALKEYMIHNGAVTSLMSGSGPTVFGITFDAQSAQKLADRLKAYFSAYIYIAKALSKERGNNGTEAVADQA